MRAAVPELPRGLAALDRIVATSVRGLAFIGGLAVLLAMAALTCADIVARNVGQGIPASWELVTFSMRWMIGLSLPYAFYAGRNIAVEAFTDWLPTRGKLVFVALGQVASLTAMGLLAWRLHVRGLDILGFETRTSDLGMLEYWHWLPLIVGAALSTLVLVALLVRDVAILLRGQAPADFEKEAA